MIFQLHSKVIRIYMFLFHIRFHYRLLQDVEYSFLCYTVGPCCLSILYIVMYICWVSLVAQPVKNTPEMRETWVLTLDWEDPWRRSWQPTPVFLPGESPWTEEQGRLHIVHGITKD